MGFIQTGRQSGRLSRRPAKRIKLAPRKSLTLGGEHTRSSVGSSQNSSGVQITQPISILERLPQEIMMKVFIDVGVTDNEIPLLNKYFYSLFKFNTSGRDGGVGFIEALVKRHFTFNLNENLNVDAVIEKVIRYREKFLTSNSPVAVSSSFQEIELTLNFYKETQTVINTELFNRKFVSENFLEMTNIRYMKVLSAEMILKEMIMRPLYIRKELKSLIEKLKALPETEEEAMALVAQELFEGTSSTISVTDSSNSTDGLKDYSPTNISEAPDFPQRFYSWGFRPEYVQMIRSLSQYFRFRFYDLNKILISCILRYNSPNYCLLDTIREIYSLVAGDSILHIQPIIEAFILLDEVKRLPEERERYESTYKALEYLLTKYYSVEEPRNDDDELWIYLGQGKDVSNLELVSQFAGTPGAHAMKLLGL